MINRFDEQKSGWYSVRILIPLIIVEITRAWCWIMEDLDFFPKKTDISETYLHSNNDFELLLCNIFEVHSTDFTSDLRTASAFCVGQGYSTAYLVTC